MPKVRLPSLTCRCGHGHDAHRHYRSGSDCALCGCARFRALVPLLGRRVECDEGTED